jgi:hypothetical protein
LALVVQEQTLLERLAVIRCLTPHLPPLLRAQLWPLAVVTALTDKDSLPLVVDQAAVLAVIWVLRVQE